MLQLDDDVESTMGGKDVRMRQQLLRPSYNAHCEINTRFQYRSNPLTQVWCDVCSLAHDQPPPDNTAVSIAAGCARELSSFVS